MTDFLFISYTISLFLAGFCVVITLMQEASQKQKTILLLTILIAISAFGYWSSIGSDGLGMRLLSQKLIYIGGCNIYYLLLLFCMQYADIKIPKKITYICFTFNMIILLSVLFCEYTPLFYKSVEFVVQDGVPGLKKEYGILHTGYQISVIIYTVAMFVVGGVNLFKERGKAKRKSYGTVGLMIAMLLPTLCYVLENMLSLSFYIVPYGFVLGESVLIFLVYRVKIYDVKNIVSEYVIKSLSDAIVIFDKKFRFKGCNGKAGELFPSLQGAMTDSDLSSIDPELERIVRDQLNHDIVHQDHIYVSTVRPVRKENHLNGYVLWIEDVTSDRQKKQLQENYRKDLEREVRNKTLKLQTLQNQMLTAFANILESRDGVTGGHAKRTGAYVNEIVETLLERDIYYGQIDKAYARHMMLAAPMHDIGKIGIPDKILNKEGKYTQEEYEIMKGHSEIGARIIQENLASLDDQEFYDLIRDIAHYHHEKWGGGGYPEGLVGKEIPLCARIMAVADVFDALVSKRPYKDSLSVSQAYEIIQSERGKSFDPELVDCFVEIRPRIEKVFMHLHHGNV